MRFSNLISTVCLISTACLFLLWNNPAFSKDMIPTGKKMVRFVCQRYNYEENNLMDKVIILDQLSTKTFPGDYSPEITGEMMIDTNETYLSGKVKGRLRYYRNVSLFNFTSDEERKVMKLTDKEDFAQRLEDLLKTQATKDSYGNIMDYSGTIKRSYSFTDILFTPKLENQREVQILMDSVYDFPIAFFSRGYGTKWPYVCGSPLFVEAMIEK